MWKVKVVNLVLAVTLCIASGKVHGEEATIPGFQSAFTSRGLAYSELVLSAGEQLQPFSFSAGDTFVITRRDSARG